MFEASGDKTKVCLMGPVAPYRGGIAQHTTMLHRALQQQADTLTLSYSRLYPNWLFPGKGCIEPERQSYREPQVEYAIDSLNPITWLRACQRIRAFQPDRVVVPWWTMFWGPWCRFTLRYLNQHDIPFTLLCHNVVDHEGSWLNRRFAHSVLRQAARFVVHNRNDASTLRRLFPQASVMFHPMPIFDCFPPPRTQLPRRAAIELLFFGLVRPYKGLDVLLDAIRQIPDVDLHLSIVGEWWSKDDSLRAKVGAPELRSKIKLVDRYVSDVEAADYFARADVVVLPYRSASGSAVIPLAYHYRTPVIATTVGGLPDMVLDGLTGWLVPSESPESLALAIARLTNSDLTALATSIDQFAKDNSWDSFVSSVIDAALPTPAPPPAFPREECLTC